MRADADTASDASLARAAASGDADALERLLERHFDRIHAICRRVTGHPEDALDAAQEALISVARRIGTFDGRAAFTTWLYRVATNAALDEVRRRNRRPQPRDELPEPVATASATSSVDARLDIDAALAGIPADFRAAVVLRDLCDLEYTDIAAILDVPVGTVRSRIARGRAAVADRLTTPEAGNSAPAPRRPIVGETSDP